MIDTEALRKKVIDLAIQGKLTEQLPSDGDAETLYAQILDHKSQLIKEGKIKKDKKLPDIAADEIPFEVPDNWKWVRVNDIFNVRSAMRIHMSDWKESGIPFFRGRDLVQLAKYGNVEPEIYISRQLYEELKNKGGVPQRNDILVSAVGTLGKVYVVTGKQEFYYKDAYILCFENFGKVCPEYVKYVIESPFLHDTIYHDAIGMTVAQMTITKANELLIPLPPIAEQKRIVNIINLILQQMDIIDDLQAKYSNDLSVLKGKIIDAGIRGKLTEQLPEDGDAEDLYAQILNQKSQLIKEGKIKKEKSLPDIAADEIPFEIPNNWKWVRLIDAGFTQTGNTPSKTHPEYFGDDIPFLGPGDIQNGLITFGRQGLSKEGIPYGRVCEKGSILQVCIGGSIGKNAITDRDTAYNQQINTITPIFCFSEYISYVLNSFYFSQIINHYSAGMATPIINKSSWERIVIPLPPLAEQKRIVAKVEDVLQVVGI